jgi:hypothetical protein
LETIISSEGVVEGAILSESLLVHQNGWKRALRLIVVRWALLNFVRLLILCVYLHISTHQQQSCHSSTPLQTSDTAFRLLKEFF